ncbi:MAG: cobyrinic acid a,c-diamide synthase [Hyphomicrobiales bacterium]|nr:MAG: cobyrinic acid a,c-diamide synthase [Hyphomicrobiales bacterium]
MAHIFLSAAHKSSGKTTLTIGLAAALARRGRVVQPFKKGPDYIDPMWHRHAAGRASYNLDFNTMTAGEIEATFAANLAGADIGLIEGNKGLYDGMDIEGSDCNAALARMLDAPVVLVLNAEGITRGIAPLVIGYQAFDPQVKIAGLILNSLVSARQESKMRAVLERYTDLPVIGAVGRDRNLGVLERHLGLVPPDEAGGPAERIAHIADVVEAGIDLDAFEAIAATAPVVTAPPVVPSVPSPDLRVGITRDSAFGFYYSDDLERFRQAGAEPVFFDCLSDPHLPDVDALFIGGGFPETHMQALSANASLRQEIRAAIEAGMPTYAECGGLMYLSRSIFWNGERHDMVGAVPADAVMNSRPQGRGLVRLAPTGEAPWSPLGSSSPVVAAHEFHYAGLENVAMGSRYAYRVERGHGIDGTNDGIVIGNLVANFVHLRHTAATPWVDRFVDFIRTTKRARAAAPATLTSRSTEKA